jgi:hypothetical protein
MKGFFQGCLQTQDEQGTVQVIFKQETRLKLVGGDGNMKKKVSIVDRFGSDGFFVEGD